MYIQSLLRLPSEGNEGITITILLWLIQFLIWTGYIVVEHLSRRDELTAKTILFFVFLYLAYIVAEYVLGKRKTAVFTTVFSLSVFTFVQQIVRWIY
jgi:hypothetical protein